MAQAKGFGVRGLMEEGTLPVNASTTFKTFDFLTVNSNGELIQGVALGSSMGAVSGITNKIVGRALMDSTDENGVQRTSASYIKPNQTEFELPLYSATPASAVPTPASQIDVAFELINVNVNGGYYAVNLDATTNVKERVTDYVLEDLVTWPNAFTAGTVQYARVWVRFDPTKCFASGQ